MIVAINYANKAYAKSQKLNAKTAKKFGADVVYCFGPEDIDKDFLTQNASILDEKRGNGLWLWKSYFIKKTYNMINEGDYLIYTDSGAVFIDKIQKLISCMNENNLDIMLFTLENDKLEKLYTKQDLFLALECDEDVYKETPQCIGGYIVIRKKEGSFVKDFIDEWLELSQQRQFISNDDNILGQENAEGFVEHRHDQSILSLLAKKHGIIRFRDPSQYGIIHYQEYDEDVLERSKYPQIINSHRLKDCDSMLKLKLKDSKYGRMIVHKKYLLKKRFMEKK